MSYPDLPHNMVFLSSNEKWSPIRASTGKNDSKYCGSELLQKDAEFVENHMPSQTLWLALLKQTCPKDRTLL